MKMLTVASSKSSQDEFLLKEYETARELTFHVDDLRARLTSYFITLSGVAITGLSVLFRSTEPGDEDVSLRALVAASFGGVAAIGVLIVLILARLRAVQFEHFRIMNNIREHYLKGDVALWNVVELSRDTLPKGPSYRSGSYFWVAAIQGLGAAATGIGVYVTLDPLLDLARCWLAVASAVVAGLGYLLMADRVYMRMAKPRRRPHYTKSPYPPPKRDD